MYAPTSSRPFIEYKHNPVVDKTGASPSGLSSKRAQDVVKPVETEVEPNPTSNIAKIRDADDVMGSTKSTTCAKNNNESMIPPTMIKRSQSSNKQVLNYKIMILPSVQRTNPKAFQIAQP
jgi:hypothetical protein